MTRVDIATAALEDHVEQRVRIAASLLGAYRIRAKARAWDGTRCHLLVADTSDAYGRQACDLAMRRGTPILAILPDPARASDDMAAPVLAATSLAPAIAQQIRQLLAPGLPVATGATPGDAMSALCRLAGTEFAGKAVDATHNGRLVRIRPQRGRVFAPSLSDLLSARDSFAAAEWTFRPATAADTDGEHDGSSHSLDAFLLQAAFQAGAQLPRFPEGRYRLKEWPDVGSAPELIESLRIASALVRAPTSVADLRKRAGDDAVDASLWAYRASDLLEQVDAPADAAPSAPAPGFTGALARLAGRFGLLRA